MRNAVLVTPSRETSTTRVGPRLFRKHALPFTTFKYKDGRVVKVTPEFALRMKENFDRGVRDIVPVPARGAGGHSNDWRDSKGRTVGLEVDPAKGIFVTIEVDEEAAKAIDEKKLGGVSLSFDEDWFDPQAQKNVGPVLRHTALTNINYIQGTDPFAPVDLSDDDEVIVLSEVDPEPDPDEVTDDLVVALAEDIAVTQLAVELAGVGQPRDSWGRWTDGMGGGGGGELNAHQVDGVVSIKNMKVGATAKVKGKSAVTVKKLSSTKYELRNGGSKVMEGSAKQVWLRALRTTPKTPLNDAFAKKAFGG